MHHSSYQNSNFLNSKASHYIQQSEYIIQQAQHLPSSNKQNYSYQLNKSNHQQNNELNKSNNSYRSVMPKDRSGIMMASKSQSIILGESSKVRNFIGLNERSKMSNNNRSMLKSCNQQKIAPMLKVLTESDLTENDSMDEHMFSSTASEHQQTYSQVNNPQENNRSTYSQHSHKFTKSNHQSTLGDTKNNYHQQNQQSKKIPQSNQIKKYPQTAQEQPSQSSYSDQESSYIEVPEYTFIPNTKLQIRHYCPKHKNRLSFQQLISLLPHQITALKKVKKLNVINCFIQNLEGIQQFQSLEEVSLRKNQIREVEELYRITNKQRIHLINILGNDIQHYHLARYRALSQVFINLQQLNDKNYAMLSRKQRGNNMKKILQKSSKLQYELRKTLKKQTLLTNKAILRMHPHLLTSQDQQTQRTNRSHQKYSQNHPYNEVSDNKVTQKDEYSYSNYNSSLSKRSISEVKSPTYRKRNEADEGDEVYEVQQGCLNPNSYSLGESSKEKSFYRTVNNNQRQELKEVSLGNLENVPITKSVKCIQTNKSSNKKTQKTPNSHNKQNINLNEIPLQKTVQIPKNNLQICTLGLDNQQNLSGHLHQPTATFAMQKEREQQCSAENKQFMFRNNKKQGPNGDKVTVRPKGKKDLRDNNEEEIFEAFQNQQEDFNNEMSLSRISKISQIPTKRLSNNRRSMASNNLREQKSRLIDPYQNTSEQSFITGNQFFPNYQNTSYMGFSQLSQWRPNQSMDQDCLLKEKKDALEEEKIIIAAAVYMKGLLRKSIYVFKKEWTRRKNMPKKKVFF